MYVRNIKIGEYRHLNGITLGNFLKPSRSSDLVVLAGPNGGGKSSVLELISLASDSRLPDLADAHKQLRQWDR